MTETNEKVQAEKRCMEYAAKAGVRLNVLQNDVFEVMKHKVEWQQVDLAQRQNHYQNTQLTLMELQIKNEGMKESLLMAKLNRKIWRLNLWNKITFKPKKS